MPAREGPRERARDRSRILRESLTQEARRARIGHGLSQEDVGRSLGMSGSQVGRIERGLSRDVSLERLVELLAAVGLELSARAYPTGRPLRDAAHLQLLARLRAATSHAFRWQLEVPLPIPGDLRAWDAVIHLGAARVGVEAETRPRDLQDLQRRVALKQRDSAMPAVILLLGDTRSNRMLVRGAAAAPGADFPVPGRDALRALREGRAPAENAVILI